MLRIVILISVAHRIDGSGRRKEAKEVTSGLDVTCQVPWREKSQQRGETGTGKSNQN